MYAVHPARAWGITPAYAGKSRFRVLNVLPDGDHPRVCGEKSIAYLGDFFNPGSPPRMRGKGAVTICCVIHYGITPAYAGKSLTIQKMTTRSRDHPRVCGEK